MVVRAVAVQFGQEIIKSQFSTKDWCSGGRLVLRSEAQA